MPLLSICIPTYNRSDLLAKLLEQILLVPGDFEICIHDDGSSDGTYAALKGMSDSRLVINSAPNAGRGAALYSCFQMAQGRFVMPFDDDDFISEEGLSRILADCEQSLKSGCVGRIYHFATPMGERLGTEFPDGSSNFLKLRADQGVSGDKKEVVLRDVLLAVLLEPDSRFRRIPTSLYWSRIALSHDVECHNIVIGQKDYLAEGMSHSIGSLKVKSAYPQFLQKCAHLRGFAKRRYSSWKFAAKALVAAVFYGAIVLKDETVRVIKS